jgi:hypothetical protein
MLTTIKLMVPGRFAQRGEFEDAYAVSPWEEKQ